MAHDADVCSSLLLIERGRVLQVGGRCPGAQQQSTLSTPCPPYRCHQLANPIWLVIVPLNMLRLMVVAKSASVHPNLHSVFEGGPYCDSVSRIGPWVAHPRRNGFDPSQTHLPRNASLQQIVLQ